ncbi:MAG: YtxH domain-containing protein [Geothrix sp.]|nr:YtxH domain-containing protein [Geothrix sp.]
MSQEHTPSMGPKLLMFAAGAVVGAVVVALTTPKTGPELRGQLRDIARRTKRRMDDVAGDVGEAWEDLKECSALAADSQKGQAAESAGDPQL